MTHWNGPKAVKYICNLWDMLIYNSCNTMTHWNGQKAVKYICNLWDTTSRLMLRPLDMMTRSNFANVILTV